MSFARWIWLAGGALAACGSRSGVDQEGSSLSVSDVDAPSPAGTAAAPVWPRRCVSDWQTLFDEESGSGLTRLAFARGEVIFSFVEGRLARGEVRAIDATSGGRGRLITTALPHELWVDAGQLLYWERQQLFDVALAGGAPQVVVDARGDGLAAGAAWVTPSELFWTRTSANEQTEFWWRARDGGQATRLASVEGGDFKATELALGSGGLVANGTVRVIALPLDGESPLELAQVTSGTLLGVGGRGAYYTRIANMSVRGGDANRYEILRAPVEGGAPIRIWRGAAGELLGAIVESGDGWLATGAYYLGGGPPRAVIVYIEASGRDHVLACHPGGARIVSRPVLDDNKLYVAIEAGSSLAIAKISLSD